MKGLAFIVCVLVFGLVVGGCHALKASSLEEVTFKVENRERVQDDNGSKYLIFTDGEVFENTDAILFGKTDSSDVYNVLKPGGTYTCQAFGWRVKLLSWYRNLKDCEVVTPAPADTDLEAGQ